MLTALEIENFKGIGPRQRIELAPLTLLFGANSAGKSTVIHALLYMNELLNHDNPDADRTALGGDAVDLGGFDSLQHGSDAASVVRVRCELSLSRLRLPSYSDEEDDSTLGVLDLDDDVDRVWIETEVAHGSRILAYSVGVNGHDEPVARIEATHASRVTMTVDLVHPSLWGGSVDEDEWSQLHEQLAGVGGIQPLEDRRGSLVMAVTMPGAVPPRGRALSISRVSEAMQEAVQVRNTLAAMSRLVVGARDLLSSHLERIAYIGPIRAIPPRNFAPQKTPDLGRWARGLAAWDWLHASWAPNDVNRWMKRLKLGYVVLQEDLVARAEPDEPVLVPYMRETLSEAIGDFLRRAGDLGEDALHTVELPPLEGNPPELRSLLDHLIAPRRYERPEPVVRRVMLVSDRQDGLPSIALAPSDVGVGIAQVLPVVVASVGTTRSPTATPSCVVVEQPELHVHPAVQVELGDMFIHAAQAGRQIIAETHSEHLLLRLLRRIREFGEAQDEAAVGPGNRRNGLGPGNRSALSESSSDARPLDPHALSVEYGVAQDETAVGPGNRRNGVGPGNRSAIGDSSADARPLDPHALSVLYVESTLDGVHVQRLSVDQRGEFADRWPKGFFTERAEELF